MPQSPDLLVSYFTIAGAVNPFTPPVTSPIPFRERAEAAGRAGFCGFGFSKDDLEHILREVTYDDILKILVDNGLVHTEIELLRGWFSTGEQGRLDELHRNYLLIAAEKLGARHIKIGASGGDYPLDHMIECFAALCDDAANVGTDIVLEISTLGRVPDLKTGTAIIEGARRPNGGLLLDLWHVTRAHIAFGEIAALPMQVIRHIELADGSLDQHGGYAEETVNRRRLCGRGEFDIAGFLSAVSTAGYNGLYGVEILSEENRSLSAAEAARLAFDTTISLFR